MKTTDDEVLETIGLNDRPACQFGIGDDLVVTGVGRTGIGIDTGCTDTGHQFVELVGNGDLGAFVGEGVDQMIDRFALLGVSGSSIDLIERVDGKEVRQFGFIIGGTVSIGTLEHQMLLIMSEPGRFERIILRTRPYNHVGKDLRLGFVLRQIDGETVIESVDTRLHRVTRYRLIGVLFRCEAKGRGDKRQKYKKPFHRH